MPLARAERSVVVENRLWRGGLVPILALTVVLALRVSPVEGQGSRFPEEDGPAVSVDEIDQATRAHLEQAQQFLAAGQWSDAVSALRRIMETDSQRLIGVPDAADSPLTRYVTIQRYGQSLLARWSVVAPEAVREYRRSVDGIAERLLQEAEAARDPARLRDVAESYFMSSSGDEAVGQLGEMLFERGDLVRARGWWERLHPALRTSPGAASAKRPNAARPLWLALPDDANDESWARVADARNAAAPGVGWLVYPDSNLSLADMRARLVLVSIAEGAWRRADRELAAVRRMHADARGTLTGREGPWAELLDAQLAASRAAEADAAPTKSETWDTFGGDSRRTHVVPRELDIGGTPLWRLSLPKLEDDSDKVSEQGPRVGEESRGLLGYFPIVLGRRVFVAQPQALRAVDLYTGKPLYADTEQRDVPLDPKDAGTFYESPHASLASTQRDVPHIGAARYTLSASTTSVFARLGSPITRWRDRFETDRRTQGFVVGVDLSAQGRLLPSFPLEPETVDWSFDGTPVCDDGRVYVGMRHQDEIRIEAHVAAFDQVSGRLVWRRSLCSSEPVASARWNEITHNLLTLQQGTLYVSTNLGVVAALDTQDGRMQWISRYPRQSFPSRTLDRDDAHFQRSLTPPVVHRDVVVFAPSDIDRLMALDGATGQLLWITPRGLAADAMHVLGVVEDRVIASGDCLYWFDIDTGDLQCQFPPPGGNGPGYARPSPRGYGRGLLAGKNVYWPTRESLYIFAQRPIRTGGGWQVEPASMPRPWSAYGVKPGNLVAANHVLLVAAADELAALRAW